MWRNWDVEKWRPQESCRARIWVRKADCSARPFRAPVRGQSPLKCPVYLWSGCLQVCPCFSTMVQASHAQSWRSVHSRSPFLVQHILSLNCSGNAFWDNQCIWYEDRERYWYWDISEAWSGSLSLRTLSQGLSSVPAWARCCLCGALLVGMEGGTSV